MTNTEREALREAARLAAVEGPYSSALFEAVCAGTRVNFRDLATPAAILSLLDDVEQLGRSASPVANGQITGIEALHKKASALIDNDTEPDIAALISHIPALCATVKHLREQKAQAQEDAAYSAKLANNKADEVTREVQRAFAFKQERDRLATGLANLYHVITGHTCEQAVALGMATSAVSSLQSQLEQLRAENERLEKVIALWFGPNSCSVCGGAPLASGKPCVCGGKGTMQAEHEGLRQALYDADISGTKIQQERDSLRGTLSALNNCRNKPVCGHCNALLREAMKSQYQGERNI